MFKKLKDIITDEVRQSPQKIQQIAQVSYTSTQKQYFL